MLEGLDHYFTTSVMLIHQNAEYLGNDQSRCATLQHTPRPQQQRPLYGNKRGTCYDAVSRKPGTVSKLFGVGPVQKAVYDSEL